MLAVVAAALAAGQQPAPAPPPEKQTIIVTGAAEPIPLSEADRDISVLPLAARQRPLFDNWFNLLQDDAGLDLEQRAPGGFLADLSIRGATFGQSLVLLNGMRVNDAQTGHFNLDLPLPFETITSIEVLKGSGSTLYGSDAIGGVVNVRTAPPETPEFRLLTGIGNFGTNQEHAIAAFGGRAFSEELAAARDFSSGFMPDRDYRNLSLSSLTSFRSALGPGGVLLALSDRPYGADQFYGNYPSWERIKTWFASAHQNIGKKTEASFAYRRHTDLFVLFRDDPSIYTNRHALESWQGDLRRSENLPWRATLSYGGEGLGESIHSTNLGNRQRTRGSGYIFYDLRSARRYSLSVGLREEVYGSGQVATSPSLSGAAWIDSHLKVRAAASRAFRLPSYTDLYYSDPANLGNPDLKPESATSYEAGVDLYIRNNLHASATVFQRRDTNVIDYVRADDNSPWVATNFDKLRFTGFEASMIYEPRSNQRITVGFTGLHGVNASAELLESKYLFNYPVQSAVVEWRGSVGKHIVARTRIGAINRFARSPYGLWDASAAWATGRIRPYIQLTNLTSTVYEEIPNIAMPKRGVVGGFEFVFAGAQQ